MVVTHPTLLDCMTYYHEVDTDAQVKTQICKDTFCLLHTTEAACFIVLSNLWVGEHKLTSQTIPIDSYCTSHKIDITFT